MDTSLRLSNAGAAGYAQLAKQLRGTEEIDPLAQQDVAQISQAPALQACSDAPAEEPGKVKETVKKVLCYATGITGGIVGLALAPFGGTILGAYGGITGRPYVNLDAFADPGYFGAAIHRKIENKTGSKALAIAGGTLAGIPAGVIYSAVLFPFLGFGMSFDYGAKIADTIFK